jgi:uncharacterized protein (DUF58 family)
MILPTRRFFWIIWLGPLLILLAGGADWAEMPATSIFVATCALALIDGALARFNPRLELARIVADNLYVGRSQPVEWQLTNRSPFDLAVALRDRIPAGCEIEASSISRGDLLEATVPASSLATLRYSIVPRERGDGSFGDLVYRVRGPLGLALAQRTVAAARPVRMLPEFANWKAAEIAVQRALTRQIGIHRHRFRGTGTIFESLRDYGVADDVRWIDWRATARAQRPITRNFETERHQNVLLLLDGSRMMATFCGNRTKFDAALEGVLLLARAALDLGDQVGLMLFSDKVDTYFHPRRDRQEVGRYLNALYNRFPRLVEPDFEGALGLAAARNQRRSLVLVFTDLTDIDSANRLVERLRAMVPAQVPVVVTIDDDALRDLEERTPQSPEEVYRIGVASQLAWEREEVFARLRASGVTSLHVAADKLAAAAIEQYLQVKRRQLA